MSDDLKKRRPRDGKFVNVNEEWEVKYWCEELDVTPEGLRQLVKDPGTSVSGIRSALGTINETAPQP
jgi:hypothetical protein